MNHLIILLAFLLMLSLAVCSESCSVELRDEIKKVHLVVENCTDIGVFSVGGLSEEGGWDRLTYFYPKPWKGTFLSVKVGETVYSNSLQVQNRTYLGEYLEKGPEISGDSIVTVWRLPEGLLVEQRLSVVEEGMRLGVALKNIGSQSVSAQARLHIDTMLGENDGAPIYIPGDGLKAEEADYSGENLNFQYWKAYNTIDNPSLVATGYLDMDDVYPSRLVVSNWKKSIYSSWDYLPHENMSILGDSAVILYYDLGIIASGDEKTISTGYVNSEPILPVSKGYFGIAELFSDKLNKAYCDNSQVTFKVDVISRKQSNSGKLVFEIRDDSGVLVSSMQKELGSVEADTVQDFIFLWSIPEMDVATYFDAEAVLFDSSGSEVDNKKISVFVDPSRCKKESGNPFNWAILGIVAVLVVFGVVVFVFINYYSRFGTVNIKKEKKGDLVKVTVWNRKKKTVHNCVILDRIVDGAEVDIITAGVLRKGVEISLILGSLQSGQVAVLEYVIKDVEFLPPAVVRWDFGKSISK